MNEKIVVCGIGLCAASVCAPREMAIDEVARQLNLSHPTGITHPWTLSEEKTFSGGEPHPYPCPDKSDTHLHYLFEC